MFARKPHVTIIFVAERGVTRIDFDRQMASVFQSQFEIDAESNLVQSVGLVVQGQPRVGQQVVVVSTSVWSQVLFLPALSVQGITENELAEALKFEAETLSGLEIDDIAISYLAGERSEDQQKYWVSVLSQIELSLIHQTLQTVGARVVQVVHPVGATRHEEKSGNEQVECWDRSCYVFENGKRILSRVQSGNNDLPVLPNARWIFGPENETPTGPLDTFADSFQLSKEAELESWARLVAIAFEKSEVAFVPVLQLARKSTGTPLRHLVSLLLALIIGGFCIWHWFFVSGRNDQLRSEIVRVQEPARQKKKYNSELALILESRTKVTAEAEEVGDQLKRVQFFIDNQKNRFAQLLDLLVELRTSDLVINNLDGSEEGVVISGISLNVESAQAFAKRLRENAVGMGWVVNPAKQEGRQHMTSGGPWDFEILLSDTGPFKKPTLSASRKIPVANN